MGKLLSQRPYYNHMSRGPDPEVSELEILHYFVTSAEPAFIASEIASEFDTTIEGARHRLEKMVEQDLLRRKKPGNRTVIYWITDHGMQYYSDNLEAL